MSIFGNEAPHKTKVYKRFAEFKRRRPSLVMNTSVIIKNIDAALEKVLSDRQVTYNEIEASLGTAAKQIHTILHYRVHVRKNCWIPHNLTDHNR